MKVVGTITIDGRKICIISSQDISIDFAVSYANFAKKFLPITLTEDTFFDLDLFIEQIELLPPACKKVVDDRINGIVKSNTNLKNTQQELSARRNPFISKSEFEKDIKNRQQEKELLQEDKKTFEDMLSFLARAKDEESLYDICLSNPEFNPLVHAFNDKLEKQIKPIPPIPIEYLGFKFSTYKALKREKTERIEDTDDLLEYMQRGNNVYYKPVWRDEINEVFGKLGIELKRDIASPWIEKATESKNSKYLNGQHETLPDKLHNAGLIITQTRNTLKRYGCFSKEKIENLLKRSHVEGIAKNTRKEINRALETWDEKMDKTEKKVFISKVRQTRDICNEEKAAYDRRIDVLDGEINRMEDLIRAYLIYSIGVSQQEIAKLQGKEEVKESEQ